MTQGDAAIGTSLQEMGEYNKYNHESNFVVSPLDLTLN